jgi:hypothetical protein
MTAPARPSGDLRVAVASLEYGGLPENGDDSAWCKSMACLLVRAPDGRFLAVVATPDIFGSCDGTAGTRGAAAGREA